MQEDLKILKAEIIKLISDFEEKNKFTSIYSCEFKRLVSNIPCQKDTILDIVFDISVNEKIKKLYDK